MPSSNFYSLLSKIRSNEFSENKIDLNNCNLNDSDINLLMSELKLHPEIAARITIIDLSENKLTVPFDLSMFPCICNLDLTNNMLTKAPDLSLCRKLQHLDLSGNKFKFGLVVTFCKDLMYLNLENCELEFLPDLTENTNLRELVICDNKLPVPPNVTNCKKLKGLWAQNNKFTQPIDISQCKKLIDIFICNNVTMPSDISVLGWVQECHIGIDSFTKAGKIAFKRFYEKYVNECAWVFDEAAFFQNECEDAMRAYYALDEINAGILRQHFLEDLRVFIKSKQCKDYYNFYSHEMALYNLCYPNYLDKDIFAHILNHILVGSLEELYLERVALQVKTFRSAFSGEELKLFEMYLNSTEYLAFITRARQTMRDLPKNFTELKYINFKKMQKDNAEEFEAVKTKFEQRYMLHLGRINPARTIIYTAPVIPDVVVIPDTVIISETMEIQTKLEVNAENSPIKSVKLVMD